MADQFKYTSKLEGSFVLVIGGSAGVGYAVAEACIEQGAGNVVLSSSNNNRVLEAVDRLRSSYPSKASRVSGFACDLAQETALEDNIVALLEAVTAEGKYRIDHIAYTAGDALGPGVVEAMNLEALKSLFLIRSFASVLLAKHAVRYMAPNRSSSITFTSGASDIRPLPQLPVLSMLTGSLRGLARGLAINIKPIRVNVVSLGVVNTELLQKYWADKSPEERDEIISMFRAQSATGELAEPQDVAEAYVYLMKDRNVTGISVDTDSGRHIL